MVKAHFTQLLSIVVMLSLFNSKASFAAAKKELPLVKVETVFAASEEIRIVFKYPGVVTSRVSGKLNSEIKGFVTRINKNLGDKVRKGEAVFFLKNAQQGLRYNEYAVTAPVSGRLSSLDVSIGQLIIPGKVVGEITDAQKLKILVEAPAKDLNRLRTGLTSEFVSNGKTIQAKIKAVSPAVSILTGTARIELEPLNGKEHLRSGLVGRAKIYLPAQLAILLPPKAVFVRADRHFVRVVDSEGKVSRKQITPGEIIGGKQSILEGLAEKDEVIIKASDFLREGDLVIRMNEKTNDQGAKQG